MDLRWVGNGLDFFADGGQSPRDEIGGAFMSQAKHHRGADIVGGLPVVALEVPAGASGDDVAVFLFRVLSFFFFLQG